MFERLVVLPNGQITILQQLTSAKKMHCAIHQIKICPLGNIIQPLNNHALRDSMSLTNKIYFFLWGCILLSFSLFIASLIEPMAWSVYTGSVIIGYGASGKLLLHLSSFWLMCTSTACLVQWCVFIVCFTSQI